MFSAEGILSAHIRNYFRVEPIIDGVPHPEYTLVIESGDGAVLDEVSRAADVAHPVAGQEVEIDGHVYTVDRVRFVDETSTTVPVRSTVRVYLRQSNRPRDAERSASIPEGVPPLMVPSSPNGSTLNSDILPASLVSVIVACGYRQLASRFDAGMRTAARLHRDGAAWMIGGVSPEELWRLSRRAKRHYAEAVLLMTRFRLCA